MLIPAAGVVTAENVGPRGTDPDAPPPVQHRSLHGPVTAALAVGLAFGLWFAQVPDFPGRRFGVLGLSAMSLYGVAVFAFALWPHPLTAVINHPPADPAERLRALERGLRAFRIGNGVTVALARHELMQLHKAGTRYEEVIAQGRAMLRMRGFTHSFESQVHMEMSVCFDFLGRAEEAEAERVEAEDCLDDRPEDALGWYVQGKLLDARLLYAEAAESYEKALETYPPENVDVREDLWIRLTLAAFHAGRTGETARRANEAIASGVAGFRLLSAHRMAGIAEAQMGDLDGAMTHRRRAYELAAGSGDAKSASDCLAAVADLHRMRGQMDEAEAVCLEAEALCPGGAREAFAVHAMMARNRGDFEAGLAWMEHAERVGVAEVATIERRMRAVFRSRTAIYKAELGRHDAAREDLEVATAELASDPKLGLMCEAARVRLLALAGRREEAREQAASVLGRLDGLPDDRATRMDVLDQVGRAQLEAGDLEGAERCWRAFLDLSCFPMAGPVGWYHLGECRRRSGDLAGAAEAFGRAAGSGIDSHFARLAARALGGGQTPA